MKKAYIILLFSCIAPLLSFAQLGINALTTDYSISFDATVSGVNNGELGFATSSTLIAGSGAPAAGALDREAWSIVTASANPASASTFPTTTPVTGGQRTNGNITTGALYAFNVATSGTNRALGFQPTASFFNPGMITLRVRNNTTATPNEITISYKIYVRNDQPRSNSVNFYFSEDNTTYTQITAADYTSPEAADATPAWVAVNRSFKVYPQNFVPNSFIFLRWYSADVSGTGSRDELAIDDITVKAEMITLTNYYSKATGNLNDLATWGTNLDGSGSPPVNFTNNYQIFNIVNRTTTAATISSNWTVSGVGSKVILAENNRVLFPASAKLTGTLELAANTFVEIQNPTADYPTLVGNLGTATLTFSGSGIQNIPSGLSCKDLVLRNGFKVFPGGTVTVTGNMTWENANIDFAGSSPFSTVNLAGHFTMNGTITYGHSRDINWLINTGSSPKNYVNNGVVSNFIQAFNFRFQQSGATLNLHNININIRGTNLDVNGTLNATGNSKITFVANSNSATVSGGGTAHLQDVECNKVGGGVTFAAGTGAVATQISGTLDVLGGNLTTNGNITLISTPTENGRLGTLGNGVTINGTLTVQRHLPASGNRWFYVGTPIKNQTLGDILPATGFSTPHTYSPITSTNKGWVAANASTPLQPGKGIIGKTTGNKTFSNTGLPVIGNGADATHTTGEAFDFGAVYSENGWMNEAGFQGWNLLANPYPSAIDWTSSAWTKTNVQNVYWLWDGTGYKFYQNDLIRSDASITKFIPIGQAFFVRTTALNPTLTVTEAAKAHETPSFFSETIANLLRINIKQNNSHLSDAAFIRLDENSTADFDEHYDIPKLANTILNIAALQDNGNALSLHTLPRSAATQPIALQVSSTQTGAYTLYFSGLHSFENNIMCFLVDKYLNTITPLQTQDTYEFDITTDPASQGKNRFQLVFGGIISTQITPNSQQPTRLHIYPHPVQEQIWVKIHHSQEPISQLQFIDLSGKVMLEQQYVAPNTPCNISALPAGLYLLRAYTSQGVITEKIIKK